MRMFGRLPALQWDADIEGASVLASVTSCGSSVPVAVIWVGYVYSGRLFQKRGNWR